MNAEVKKGDYIVFKKRLMNTWTIHEGLVLEVIKDCKGIKVKDRTYSPDWYNLEDITICSCKEASLKQYLNQWDLGLVFMISLLVFAVLFIIMAVSFTAIRG